MSKVIIYYIKNLLFPIHLCVDYVIPLSHSIFEPDVLFSLFIITTLFIIAIKLYKNHRELFFGISYFFVALLPVSNIIPTGFFMADRFLYMPSLGFCIILAYLLTKFLKNKVTLIPIFLIILLFYSSCTIKRNILWQDEMALWKDVIKKFPNSFIAYKEIGRIYSERDEPRKAIKYFNKAIQLHPKWSSLYYHRGVAYLKKGLLDKALSDFNKALQLSPRFARAYNNRGYIYNEKGLLDEALTNLNKALQLDPKLIEAYNNRGITYLKKGLVDEAISNFNKVLQLNPQFVEAYNNRAVAFVSKGSLDRALTDINKGLQLNPRWAQAYNTRGIIYYQKGDNELSIKDFKKSADLGYDLARKNLKKYFNIDY